MKALVLTLASFLVASFSFATVWNVNVGGGQSPLPVPFYAPQNLTILQGDTVLWTWSSGTHNVTSTSGPVGFVSADLSSPATFQFVFTVAGFYEYECSLFSHSDTQFGSITVETVTNLDKPGNAELAVGPVPMDYILRVKSSDLIGIANVKMYEAVSGKVVRDFQAEASFFEIMVGDLPKGAYLIDVECNGDRRRKLVTK